MNQNILSQSGHTAYGIREFVIDTDDDIENLPIDIPMGSAALSIESGNVFILNSKDEWKNVGGGNGQSGGTSGPGISAVGINDQGHLIITTTAGTTYDAGLAKGADGKSFTFDELTEEQKAELKGDPFTFEDLTAEQIEQLKGPKGDTFTVQDLSPEDLELLKGDPGPALTFDDLTELQKEELKGPKGDNYELDDDDKNFIALLVYDKLVKAEGLSY